LGNVGGSPTAAEVPCNVQGDFRHGDAIDEVVQGYALEGEDEDTDEEEEEYQVLYIKILHCLKLLQLVIVENVVGNV
jgi:hypothetical protein